MKKNNRQAKLEQLEKFGWHEWWDLCREVGIGNRQADIYQTITTNYAAENRYYHTIQHVLDCLHLLEKVKKEVDNLPAMKLALWFHDIVQGAAEHEKKSAAMMQEVLGKVLCGQESVKQASLLIMDTVHPSEPQTNDGKIISDLDLAGLAGTFGVFQANGELIRQEFAQLTDEEFYRGRLDFFHKILAGPIFKHACFQQFEAKARANITKDIVLIKQQLGE